MSEKDDLIFTAVELVVILLLAAAMCLAMFREVYIHKYCKKSHYKDVQKLSCISIPSGDDHAQDCRVITTKVFVCDELSPGIPR